MPDRRVDQVARDRIDEIKLQTRRSVRQVQAGLLIAFVSQALALVISLNEIQSSRENVIRNACQEQNGRNSMARVALDELDFPPEAAAATTVLINALTPIQNCDDVVQRRLQQ